MKVSVKDIDCLVACKQLIDAGNNPVVLNLADILVPGGCVESGSGAQEESIFRRSNYMKTLTADFYPRKSSHSSWLQAIACLHRNNMPTALCTAQSTLMKQCTVQM